MRRPISVLQHSQTVAEIVNLTAIAAVAADMYGGGERRAKAAEALAVK
jgi:hypothetical protein